jgi:hypothetical protein
MKYVQGLAFPAHEQLHLSQIAFRQFRCRVRISFHTTGGMSMEENVMAEVEGRIQSEISATFVGRGWLISLENSFMTTNLRR